MNQKISQDKPESRARAVRRKIIPVLGLLFVAGITIGILYFYKNFPQRVEELKTYGYLGLFLISLLLNATIILPVGNIIMIATFGAALPSSLLVGVVGGIGATIGEITGFIVGYSGRTIVAGQQKTYLRLERWVRKWGAFAIFILAIVPFFFDLAGIAAGALRMPFWKFFIACWLGRTILYVVVALIGFRGWETILSYFNLK